MTVSRSLIQEVEAAAQRYPGKVAVKFKGAELNYKELWAKVSYWLMSGLLKNYGRLA